MGFNYDNSVGSNNNFIESNSGENNMPEFKKILNFSIFNRCFSNNKTEIDKADTDKNGLLSITEVRNWIKFTLITQGNLQDLPTNSENNSIKNIVKNIANFLGITYVGENQDIQSLKIDLLKELDNYQDIDFNRDAVVTQEELEYANKILPKSTTANRNNAIGKIDGYIDNIQGTFGSCWLLSAIKGLADNAPDLYNQLITQDQETGEVTVTIPSKNGKPFIYKISKEKLLCARSKALEECRKKGIEGRSKYLFSTDIDAIAFEKAFLALERKETKEALSSVKNYLNNSVLTKPETYNGIPLDKILEMSDEELNKLSHDGVFAGFIYNTEPKDKSVDKPSYSRLDYTSEADYIRTIVSYCLNTELEIDLSIISTNDAILKPDKKINDEQGCLRKEHQLLEYYIEHSTPINGVEKPNLNEIDNRNTRNVSIIDGDTTGGYDLKVLLGNDVKIKTYDNENISNGEIKKLLEEYTSENRKMVFCTFKDSEDEDFVAKHRFLIKEVIKEGRKYIILSNPHDSEKEKSLSIDEFLNLYKRVVLVDLPDNINT